MREDKIVAIHSFPVWLPQTQPWMYNQARYLPSMIDVQIVCERTEHLDEFGLPNIHCLHNRSQIRYIWEKGLRKLKIRYLQSYLASVAGRVDAGIIHSHFGEIGWNNLMNVDRVRAKHVVTFYGYDVTRLPAEDKKWKVRYRELFDKVDLILCEGPHMAGKIVELGCNEEKIRVQHLGVDIQSILFFPRIWQVGSPLQISHCGKFPGKEGDSLRHRSTFSIR